MYYVGSFASELEVAKKYNDYIAKNKMNNRFIDLGEVGISKSVLQKLF